MADADWCATCGNAIRRSFRRLGLYHCRACVLRCGGCARPFNRGAEAARDRHQKECAVRRCDICLRFYDAAAHPYCPFAI